MTRWVFNEDGWTDWQQHDGKGCPCVGWWAEWMWDNGMKREGFPMSQYVNSETGVRVDPTFFPVPNTWDFSTHPKHRTVRYRVRKPKGAEMLERLVQDVHEPVDA